MKNNNAVVVENISKSFKIPLESSSGIKQKLINMLKGRKGYRDFTALDGISFVIEKGDFFGIVGRNGSGKSTLLKTIAQIYYPEEGTVKIDGTLVPFIELGVGFNPELTGRENVYLNGALLGFGHDELDKMYDDIVGFAELEDFMDERLKNYSSGMQVRLAFSIAIRARGDILLLDEVLAVGDEAFQRKCFKYFDELREQKKTVILVSHSMEAVRQFCNKAILIDKHRIIHSGNPDDIASEYTKLFIQETVINVDEKDRFGTGEVVMESIGSEIEKDTITISFAIKNNTAKKYDNSLDIGIDFYTAGQLVTGVSYSHKDQKYLSLEPKQTKKIKVVFPNSFGKHVFDVNLNIKTDNGRTVCDEHKNAIQFDNLFGKSAFFKILTFADFIEEKDDRSAKK